MSRRSEAPDALGPYVPPQPTGGHCRQCGQAVLTHVYREGAYVELARPVSCALGIEHVCTRKISDARSERDMGAMVRE